MPHKISRRTYFLLLTTKNAKDPLLVNTPRSLSLEHPPNLISNSIIRQVAKLWGGGTGLSGGNIFADVGSTIADGRKTTCPFDNHQRKLSSATRQKIIKYDGGNWVATPQLQLQLQPQHDIPVPTIRQNNISKRFS